DRSSAATARCRWDRRRDVVRRCCRRSRARGARPGTGVRRTRRSRDRRRSVAICRQSSLDPVLGRALAWSYLEQLGFLAAEGGIDRVGVLVGDLLQLLLGSVEVVGRDLALLFVVLEVLAGVTANVA